MTELRQRDPRQEEPLFLAFLRRKPCCVCFAPPRSQAAHIRMACLLIGKEYTGKAEKPHDRWATPLCADCHREQHGTAERKFWEWTGVDPFKVAATLYAQFCRRQARDPEQRAKVVKRAAKAKRRRVQPFKRHVGFAQKSKASLPKGRSQWPAKGSRKLRSRSSL